MSTVTAEALRANSTEELNEKLREAKEELFNLRFQAATGQLESHGRLTAVRKRLHVFTQYCVNVNQGLEQPHE